MNNIYYVILACYPDKGMKSCGSKGLLPFHNKKLLEHQINWIKNTTNSDNIIIIADFDFHKILKSLDNRLNLIFANGSNPVLECCKHIPDGNICFIDYGCVFDPKLLLNLTYKQSEIVCIKNANTTNNLDIGCTISNDYIEHIFFDLPSNKFCNIFTITKEDRVKINTLDDFHNNLLYFEIINILIHHRSIIKPVFIPNNFIYFNHMRQKNAINKFIKNQTN